jgi:hypothetical protein
MKENSHLNISPVFLEGLRKRGWSEERLEQIRTGKAFSAEQSRKKCKWVICDYQKQLELAKQTRNALLAVQAELHRLYFDAWDKKAPIVFGSGVLRSLGFNHHDKIRALRALEKAGWITVQWHKRKSPQVTIIGGLTLGF